MLATPVILLGMFMAAEATGLLPLLKKREWEYQTCYDEFYDCNVHLRPYSNLFNDPSRLPEFVEEEFIDQLCRSFAAVLTCYDVLLVDTSCELPYILERMDERDAVARFVCSSKTKELLMAMRDSPCIHEMATIDQVVNGMSACVQLLNQSPVYQEDHTKEICVIEDVVKPCVVDVGSRFCGDSVVEFGLHTWSRLKNVISTPANCSSASTDSGQRILKKDVFPYLV